MKTKEHNTTRVVNCYGCKKIGHYARNCPTLQCSNCNIKGQATENCRKKSKSGDCAKILRKNDHKHAFRISDSKHGDVSGLRASLLIDSGASTHIVNNREKFDVFNSDFNAASHTIELADGSKSNLAKARGTAHIKLSDSDGKMCKATLNNALFIPEYPTNIFSVHEATKHGSTVTFGPNESKLTTEDGKQFNIVQNGKLFYLETDDKLCAVTEHSLKDLHVMMGHCNISDLRKLGTVVNVSKKPDTRATSPLHLVHSDLAGPMTPTGKGGFRWGMCFVLWIRVSLFSETKI